MQSFNYGYSVCGLTNDLKTEECQIPCPVDCALTEWSSWSHCQPLCGLGQRKRNRKVSLWQSDFYNNIPPSLITKLASSDIDFENFTINVFSVWSNSSHFTVDITTGLAQTIADETKFLISDFVIFFWMFNS